MIKQKKKTVHIYLLFVLLTIDDNRNSLKLEALSPGNPHLLCLLENKRKEYILILILRDWAASEKEIVCDRFYLQANDIISSLSYNFFFYIIINAQTPVIVHLSLSATPTTVSKFKRVGLIYKKKIMKMPRILEATFPSYFRNSAGVLMVFCLVLYVFWASTGKISWIFYFDFDLISLFSFAYRN